MICHTCRGSHSREDEVPETQSAPPEPGTASVEQVRRKGCVVDAFIFHQKRETIRGNAGSSSVDLLGVIPPIINLL